MFDQVSRAAERVATGMSRRAFFGWLGRGAVSLTALVGAASVAIAGHGGGGGGGTCVPATQTSTCCPTGWYVLTGVTGPAGRVCYFDSKCTQKGVLCQQSDRCCGGTGYCQTTTTCFSDPGCSTPC
jgi:hypothetical protein